MRMHDEELGLKIITVKKDELIEKIIANRENHIKEHKEAMEGFFAEARKAAHRAYRTLGKGQIPEDLHFDVPGSHKGDYDKMIELLRMSADDTLEITYEQFCRYVKDEWSWSSHFKHLHTLYNSSS